jgi:hypothetical protein
VKRGSALGNPALTAASIKPEIPFMTCLVARTATLIAEAKSTKTSAKAKIE